MERVRRQDYIVCGDIIGILRLQNRYFAAARYVEPNRLPAWGAAEGLRRGLEKAGRMDAHCLRNGAQPCVETGIRPTPPHKGKRKRWEKKVANVMSF